jgi:hypothetical protein
MISNVVIKKQPTTNSSFISQVYIVPLPDFTVYPEKINDGREKYWKLPFKLLKLLFWPRGHILKGKENLSPFLRMIRKDISAEIYDNPSMAAVIDFKWKAARNHFLRHSLIYIVFALTFAFVTDSIKGSVKFSEEHENSIFLSWFPYVLFYWIGFYLLNTERIQIKYDGWKRYFSLYNFFDLFSVILPLVTVSAGIGFNLVLYFNNINLEGEGEITDDQLQEILKFIRISITLDSFAVIVIWMEILLVSFSEFSKYKNHNIHNINYCNFFLKKN